GPEDLCARADRHVPHAARDRRQRDTGARRIARDGHARSPTTWQLSLDAAAGTGPGETPLVDRAPPDPDHLSAGVVRRSAADEPLVLGLPGGHGAAVVRPASRHPLGAGALLRRVRAVSRRR